MKQETKELVEFIKDCVFRYQTELKRGEVDLGMIDGEEEDKTCNKAIAFLNSLPKIESHLTKGGYIQDKNGTPCCDGDKILFCGEYNGFLRFGFMDESDKKYNCLPHFWLDFGGKLPTISGSVYFEKAE